ncbi:helix-turn-helix domain-containing protein [Paenibacillus silvae]|uniref:helix-turn-helix domain-containing protein n=1 Tax=Paenibacillus silvae TaxID=1325358 RepID=UPI0023E7D12C|nr:helix-turn-helix transcriptional regulator [Paenibacillus silvae]
MKVRIIEARTTQAQLSRRTGYSPQQISNWIHNRDKMSYEAAALCAIILNCHAEDFYEWHIS